MQYRNPIIPGFHPDPSICRDEKGGYYLVTSSFEYAPGVPLFYSTDLVNWTCIGHCLESEEQVDLEGTPPSGGIFAPTIRKHGDTYYMITTNVTRGVFYVTSKNPQEGWSKPIFLKGVRGIDPSLTFVDDRVYMQIAVEGSRKISCIAQAELNLETGELLSELRELSYGTGGRDVEAPHIYRKDGYFYLMCAEGGTREGHMITIQRSKDIWGPFLPFEKNPILTNRDNPNEELQAVGHGDLVQDYEGNWWCVALAHRAIHFKHVLGRETILLPVSWEDNQWPEIYKGYAESCIETKKLSCEQKQCRRTVDTFSSAKLPTYWNKLRKFQESRYQIDTMEQTLTLKGQDVTLDEVAAPTFLCRRQEHFSFSFQTEVLLEDTYKDCGLALYMDPRHHMELCIHTEGEQPACFVRKTVGEIQVSSEKVLLHKGKAVLCITGDKTNYRFILRQGEMEQELDYTLCQHLSTEVSDSDYTGVYMGIYAQTEDDCLKITKVIYEGTEAV